MPVVSELRITYAARSEAAREAELDVLARAYAFVLKDALKKNTSGQDRRASNIDLTHTAATERLCEKPKETP
jgi:hypothetical protein